MIAKIWSEDDTTSEKRIEFDVRILQLNRWHVFVLQVAAACVLLAATAMAAPQLTLRDIANNPDANPLGLTEAELAADMYDVSDPMSIDWLIADCNRVTTMASLPEKIYINQGPTY